jgi:uncharacterized Ntn-hydrolase superfamily protein
MRMRTALCLLTALLVAAPASATFSIVAIDPANGDLGVAVASAAVAIGSRVGDGEAGFAAVATIGNAGYKRRALELLKMGLSVQQVVDRLLAEDTFPNKEIRQVAIIDARGNIAAHVGPGAQAVAGLRRGATYAVIGNGVVGVHVLEAVGAAFEKATGELAERLYTALKAGSLAGGDRQPDTATGLLVLRQQHDNNDGYISIRVDSDADPFHQLRRILDLQLARNYASRRNYLVEQGELGQALESAEKAAAYEPTVAANHLHQGFLAYLAGRREAAAQAFARARQLTVNFKQLWDATLANPDFTAYRKVRDDQAFTATVTN